MLCSFKRIEGGSAYQKNLLRKIRLDSTNDDVVDDDGGGGEVSQTGSSFRAC